MATALASLQKHRNVLFIDVVLLTALYLVPSFSHLTALPLYKFEPMRIALVVALLFTNRKFDAAFANIGVELFGKTIDKILGVGSSERLPQRFIVRVGSGEVKVFLDAIAPKIVNGASLSSKNAGSQVLSTRTL